MQKNLSKIYQKMKIFSNFDTKLKKKLLTKAIKKFGKDKVILISKSKLFLAINVYPLLILRITTTSLILYLGYKFVNDNLVRTLLILLILIETFFIVPPMLKKYIDYAMDFTLITPNRVTKYDQEAILKRDVTTINTGSIKSIIIKKNGLIKAIFNNGNIHFFTEGDEQFGEIILEYVYKPEEKKDQILKIIRMNLKEN